MCFGLLSVTYSTVVLVRTRVQVVERLATKGITSTSSTPLQAAQCVSKQRWLQR